MILKALTTIFYQSSHGYRIDCYPCEFNTIDHQLLILQQLTLSIQLKKKKAAAIAKASWIQESGSVSACSKLWFFVSLCVLDGMEGIFWFCNPLFLFLNCGFCVLHRKLFSITSPQKRRFLFERSVTVSGSLLCIWLFGCLKFPWHLFSHT